MGEVYGELIRWAVDCGIKLNGIEPRTIPGRGTGMFATRALENLLVVPTRAVRTLDNVPKAISSKLPKDTSVHCLLAAYLSLEMTDEFAIWSTAFPDLASFETSTPLMWPSELQVLLPSPAKKLLKKQQMNFQRDWNAVSAAFPDVSRQQYLHAWLLVNTRSFYYMTQKLKKVPHDDRLALMPVADLFNHADVGCETKFSPHGYTFIANRAHQTGEEVHISYGGHSNDFLLAEYGFVLAENRWDTVCLDDVILPSLSKEQSDELEERRFLGDYILDPETMGCFRTQVALRALCCKRNEWIRFADAEVDNEVCRLKANVLLQQSLDKFVDMIHGLLEDIANLDVGETSQRDTLALRWRQIEAMITQTTKGRDE